MSPPKSPFYNMKINDKLMKQFNREINLAKKEINSLLKSVRSLRPRSTVQKKKTTKK